MEDADRTQGRAQTAHEGRDVLAEYAALTERVALVDDSDRIIVDVSGERAGDMINGLVTNALEPLEEGRSVYTFMLTPKGRIVAELRVIPKPVGGAATGSLRDTGPWSGDVWLDAPAACAEQLLAHLSKYLPPLYARFEATEIKRFGIVGPMASQALRRFMQARGRRTEDARVEDLEELQAAPLGPEPERPDGSGGSVSVPVLLVRREAIEGPGFDVYTGAADAAPARSALLEAVQAVDGAMAGRPAREILRVESGMPVYGREITAQTLPQETSQTDRAVNFEKGCYTGQEVVARIHYRGHVNRRLVGFALGEAPEPLVPDTRLFLGDREVAEILTAVVSPRHGPIALGYARREIDVGAMLSREAGGGADVRVCGIPFTST